MTPRPDQPIPICLVITDLDVGGAERALVALALGLNRRRWRPSVIALGPEAALADPLRAGGIPTTCLDVDRRRPLRAVAKLASHFREDPPALVQSFMFHANIAARLAARSANRPIVVGGLRVAEREKRWHLRLDRLTSGLSAGSVCVSEGVRRHAIENRLALPDRLWVIPNGIDPTRFDASPSADRSTIAVPETSPLTLFVGRLERQKGVGILISAAKGLLERGSAWHFALVGDGPLRGEFEQATADSPRFHWLGRRDDVPAWLKASDLLVLPSLWEGMPNVVLEAMAAGRAVIASEVEGSEDLVVPGETGWLVPAGEVGSLASALEEAERDFDRVQRFGECGRNRVETKFSQSAVVAAYERLWADLLGFERSWLESEGSG